MLIRPALLTVSLLSILCVAPAIAQDRPQIPVLDAATIEANCEPNFAKLRQMRAALEARTTSDGFFVAWNDFSIAEQDALWPLDILSNVLPDKAARDAAANCEVKSSAYNTETYQSDRLYRLVKDSHPTDPHTIQLRQDLLDRFEDSGITLAPDDRAKAKALNTRMSELSKKFEENLRDDKTKVTFTPAEMAGLPDSYLKVQKRDDVGNYVLPLAYPAYFPFIQNASNGDARHRYQLAMLSQGGMANIEALDQLVATRYELAQLYGYPDWASYVLKRRMAKDPATVYKFLADVKKAVSGLEKTEVEELRLLKAQDLGLDQKDVKLYRWDATYYQEKYKKLHFNVNMEATRKYFPTDKALAYTMKVATTLYGIRFVERTVPTWHPDVRYFDVFDIGANGATGTFLGGIYLDLYPREGKYGHAAAWPVRARSTMTGRTPISALVTNFDRTALSRDELTTLMHEFGHVLHGVLSEAEYVDHAGTRVKRDFVEAPSQMFEEWSRRKEPLALFREVCADCPVLSEEEIGRLEAARRYGQGIFYSRQLEYATFDMELAGPHPGESLEVWNHLDEQTAVGPLPGSLFPATFTHIASGYSAGYYGYMWSEVLALDMLSGFHGHLMDPVAGRRYRTEVISQGGQLPPEQLVENFLGRKPNSDAFFKEITGNR